MINDEFYRVNGDGSMIISDCFDDMIEYVLHAIALVGEVK